MSAACTWHGRTTTHPDMCHGLFQLLSDPPHDEMALVWWSVQHDDVAVNFKNKLTITGSICHCEEPDTWEILPVLDRSEVRKGASVLAGPSVVSVVLADLCKAVEAISPRRVSW